MDSQTLVCQCEDVFKGHQSFVHCRLCDFLSSWLVLDQTSVFYCKMMWSLWENVGTLSGFQHFQRFRLKEILFPPSPLNRCQLSFMWFSWHNIPMMDLKSFQHSRVSLDFYAVMLSDSFRSEFANSLSLQALVLWVVCFWLNFCQLEYRYPVSTCISTFMLLWLLSFVFLTNTW